MLWSCRLAARKACTLSALKWGSSCCSSTSNPGASLTKVAENSPPRRTVATSASACPAILALISIYPGSLHPDLFHRRALRQCVLTGRRLRVMDLLHRVHAPVGFREQCLDIETIFRQFLLSYLFTQVHCTQTYFTDAPCASVF